MRDDRRPYWVKKIYMVYRGWYTRHFIKPACDFLGDHATFMKPWYVHIGGPNIRIGKCATVVAEPDDWVRIGVWGNQPGQGRITIGDYVMISPGSRISACNISIRSAPSATYVTAVRREAASRREISKIDMNSWLDTCGFSLSRIAACSSLDSLEPETRHGDTHRPRKH
jgi:hypothetical protein